jgi:hypothetical protein
MKNDRRTILSLVALGRITPYQAERLLIACNESREGLWLIACAALGSLVWIFSHADATTLLHSARSWFEGVTFHRSLAFIDSLLGGLK